MTVDELITALQKLSAEGHGELPVALWHDIAGTALALPLDEIGIRRMKGTGNPLAGQDAVVLI